MKKIRLTKGYYAMVDDNDLEFISQWKWKATVSRTRYSSSVYATREIIRDGKRGPLGMHQMLVHAPEVDHIDGNGLNNQRHNLRPATHAQNLSNQKKTWRETSSRFKGVTWDKASKRWRAQIQPHGKSIKLGRFHRECDAATAYNFAAYEHFGEFARMNTPDSDFGN